jgi:hypothetical protein
VLSDGHLHAAATDVEHHLWPDAGAIGIGSQEGHLCLLLRGDNLYGQAGSFLNRTAYLLAVGSHA